MNTNFNLAEINEAIAAAIPERECIVFRDRRFTWAQFNERTRRLGNYLRGRGLGCHQERGDAAELRVRPGPPRHLSLQLPRVPRGDGRRLQGARRAVQRQLPLRRRRARSTCSTTPTRARSSTTPASRPTSQRIRAELPNLEVLLQVRDDSGHALLPGAVDYDDGAGAVVRRRGPTLSWSPDDLYILYTGGTTGMPKGVLWRQEDIFFGALGGTPARRRRSSPASRPSSRRRAAATCAPARRRRSCTARRTGWRSLPCTRAARWSSSTTRAPRSGRHLVDDRAREGALPHHRRRRLRPAADRSARRSSRTTCPASASCSPAAPSSPRR